MRVGKEHLEWWLDFYPNLKWTFAKTYADTAPHSYVVRGKNIHFRDYEVLRSLIYTFGDPQKYWSTTNLYLVGDGQKWWSDFRLGEDWKVVNMAPADQFFGTQNAPITKSPYYGVYDRICLEYDKRSPGIYDDQLKEILNHAIDHPWPKVLDVGAGTGRLLDMEITHARQVVAVDPSQGMLNQLLRKHHHTPRDPVGDIRPAKMEDVYEDFMPGEFDLVAGLYGSPSYVFPGVVEMLPRLGRITALMTYKPGYLPEWWKDQDLPANVESVASMAHHMGGEHYDLGDFDLFVIENKESLF